MRRFRVAEESMRPTLVPGDEFVVTGSRGPVVGEVVALPHPRRDDFWLVKRLLAGPGALVDGHGVIGAGMAWVGSDNRHADAQDSASFGPVPFESLLPRVERLDSQTFAEAIALLCAEDPSFAEVVAEHGLPDFWQRPAGLPTLVWLIMEQQVSLESGAAMYRRLNDLLGPITPEALVRAGEPALREIGVTRQKAGYLIDLAIAIIDGEMDVDGLGLLPPGEARHALLSIKGVGPWTADAYLLAALRLPDVFPVGDRALQVGTAEVLGLRSVPGEDDLELVSLPWRPLRAVAARLIWHSYLSRRGRVEPAGPMA